MVPLIIIKKLRTCLYLKTQLNDTKGSNSKSKIDTFNIIKIKDFCAPKNTIMKVKRTNRMKKMF
jgi:hypothetical protein